MQLNSNHRAISNNMMFLTGFKIFLKVVLTIGVVLTLKVVTSEVVLTIEVALTFERAYNRAHTVWTPKVVYSADHF